MGAARGSGLVTSPPSSTDAHLLGAQLTSRHSDHPFGLRPVIPTDLLKSSVCGLCATFINPATSGNLSVRNQPGW